MNRVEFPKTSNVQFFNTMDGKQVAFSANAPIDNQTGEELPFEVMLVTDDQLSFRLEIEKAKVLLEQLKRSIGVGEFFNEVSNREKNMTKVNQKTKFFEVVNGSGETRLFSIQNCIPKCDGIPKPMEMSFVISNEDNISEETIFLLTKNKAIEIYKEMGRLIPEIEKYG